DRVVASIVRPRRGRGGSTGANAYRLVYCADIPTPKIGSAQSITLLRRKPKASLGARSISSRCNRHSVISSLGFPNTDFVRPQYDVSFHSGRCARIVADQNFIVEQRGSLRNVKKRVFPREIADDQ